MQKNIFSFSLFSTLFLSSSLIQAQTTTAVPVAQQGGWESFIPMILILVVFYFFMIRPQMKRAKEHKALLDGLQKGDEVVTQGGLIGKVSKVDDNYVSIIIANNTEIMVQKPAVSMLLPKGTIKGQGLSLEK